jgi:hypothetical protein
VQQLAEAELAHAAVVRDGGEVAELRPARNRGNERVRRAAHAEPCAARELARWGRESGAEPPERTTLPLLRSLTASSAESNSLRDLGTPLSPAVAYSRWPSAFAYSGRAHARTVSRVRVYILVDVVGGLVRYVGCT